MRVVAAVMKPTRFQTAFNNRQLTTIYTPGWPGRLPLAAQTACAVLHTATHSQGRRPLHQHCKDAQHGTAQHDSTTSSLCQTPAKYTHACTSINTHTPAHDNNSWLQQQPLRQKIGVQQNTTQHNTAQPLPSVPTHTRTHIHTCMLRC